MLTALAEQVRSFTPDTMDQVVSLVQELDELLDALGDEGAVMKKLQEVREMGSTAGVRYWCEVQDVSSTSSSRRRL